MIDEVKMTEFRLTKLPQYKEIVDNQIAEEKLRKLNERKRKKLYNNLIINNP